MNTIEIWTLLRNVVTVFGLPLAIFVSAHEQRKEREGAEAEVYLLLSDAYADFLKLVIANPDLCLRSKPALPLPPGDRRRGCWSSSTS